MEAATSLLNQMSCRVVNIVGNHELYNFDRSALQRSSHPAPADMAIRSSASYPSKDGAKLPRLLPGVDSRVAER